MTIDTEHFRRINKAVNFINENPSENPTLEELSKLSNYSPFHFQKLFKSITGETPKQYILRVRLETAAHSLVMFREKSVTEIALDFGFSSSSTFARAFKNYFGISAQELRNTSEEERRKLFLKGDRLLEVDRYFLQKRYEASESERLSDVTVTRIETFQGIFINASLDDEPEIDAAFKKLARLTKAHDLMTDRTTFIGVINPHQKLYQAIATVELNSKIPKGLSVKEIPAGKYAVVKIRGDINQPFETMQLLTKFWLPDSGYEIGGIVGFETLSADPLSNSYREMERKIHIPIKAAQ